ncbi:AASS, partial [Symbiodinium microadriaticum]
FKVIVQPCTRRIFTNREYQEAGAVIQDDLSEASLVIGVKQLDTKALQGQRNFLFFSHTIKAQPHNMEMLDHILTEKCRLFDYECITRNGSDSEPRLVAFGKYAGIAGMIDGMQGLGQKLLADGFSTPFLNVPTSHMYQNLDHARYTIRNVGAQGLSPVVVGFTGDGNVSQGAQSIFSLLPHEMIQPDELPQLADLIKSGKKRANKVYGVQFLPKDLVRRKDGSAFELNHYFSHPELYEPRFHTDYLPYLTMLCNCMYWDFKYPRLITKEQIKALRASGNKKFRFLSDVSCDVGGSVEFLSKCTDIDHPFFHYIPETDKDTDELTGEGVGILSVEILPTELARDSSEHFGNALMPLIPPMLQSNGSDSHTDMADLPNEMKRACIASHGELMPKWSYINRLRQQKSALQHSQEYLSSLYITGHLFDTGLINSILDELERFSDITFSLSNLDVRPNASGRAVKSKMQIQLTGSKEHVQQVLERITAMAEGHQQAEAQVEADAVQVEYVMYSQAAEHAIRHKTDMVTASYVSEDMRKMDTRVKQAGITILNEVGLDPGIDHMMIMKAVDDIHSRGGKVEELVSLCGGLPVKSICRGTLRYEGRSSYNII